MSRENMKKTHPYGYLETGWSTMTEGMCITEPNSSNVVFFDLETSGVNPYWDKIIEIGAVRLTSDTSIELLVQPGKKKKLNPKIVELTGITEEMLKSGTTLLQALNIFVDFVGKCAILVAHNSDGFDQRFLEEAFAACGHRVPPGWRFIDSYKVAQYIHAPGTTKYSLIALADKYNVRCKPTHRALQDAKTLKEVYIKMVPYDGITAYRMYRKNEFNYLIL